MDWIRFETQLRYHAVYVQADGMYFTWCARVVRIGGESGNTQEPPARCGCCQSRIRHPWLVPDKLRRLRDGETPEVRPARRQTDNGQLTLC